MKITEVQTRLRELSTMLGCTELRTLADELHRRKLGKIARKHSDKMTAEKRADIIRVRELNPHITQAEIAARLHVNPGRVSETLYGKRV